MAGEAPSPPSVVCDGIPHVYGAEECTGGDDPSAIVNNLLKLNVIKRYDVVKIRLNRKLQEIDTQSPEGILVGGPVLISTGLI